MFTKNDIKQIHKRGITTEQVTAQVEQIKKGMTYSNLVAAATIGKGIEKYNDEETKAFIRFYEAQQDHLQSVKFVPASGAASRMFKFLFQFLNHFNPENESINDYIERTNDHLIKSFITHLEKFPFYELVWEQLETLKSNFESLQKDQLYKLFIEIMLDEGAFNYSALPKGLLPFHKYPKGVVTAFEEHLFESTCYATSNGNANLHFTVSEKHHNYFISELNSIKNALEEKTATRFNVTFSYQKQATEVLALTKTNSIFRKNNGSILFRPAGHGALLENLNALDYDIVFIKNIDNIVVAEKNIKVSAYKKLLAGVLLKAQAQVFKFLNAIDRKTVTEKHITAMVDFATQTLNLILDETFKHSTLQDKIAFLRAKFDRPIRVCGMVKNQGEPGGGPFWVKDKKGNISLQIVEFAQINFSKKNQQGIVYKATHFNPTDLVCGLRNYKGKKFDLMRFVDHDAAFITTKTQNGVAIKALELPGLWNGSMAYWNSIFVEVPLETFNPVKTVNDLLRPAHQV